MAYNRVNWQNQPSTATPINADNLNKMDKGIKDIEEGKISKSDIVQTDTINDPNKVASSAVTHALGQEIDTLNNNLVNYERLHLRDSQQITEGTDLVTLTTPGVYYCRTNAIAGTLLNCPTSQAFRMTVYHTISEVRVSQKIEEFLGGNVYIQTVTLSPLAVNRRFKYTGTEMEV